MSDHYHYEYAAEHHGHSGYADGRHDHDSEYAERYHRHYDDECTAAGLREDLGRAEEKIRELEDVLNAAIGRIARLEERLHVPAYEPADEVPGADLPDACAYHGGEGDGGEFCAGCREDHVADQADTAKEAGQ